MLLANPPLAVARPHPKLWLQILLVPMFTIVLVAMPVGMITSITAWQPKPPMIIGLWLALSLAIMVWCAVRDPELLTWTLTEMDLRRGRHAQQVVLSFDEIESIIVGVPPVLPWYLRWMRLHPNGNAALQIRSASILVRLQGGRRIPLNFVTGQFVDGPSFMDRFLQLHQDKLVGQDTYTPAERKKLETADLNRIFVV